MRKTFTLILFLITGFALQAQITFHDDFESYNVGDYIDQVSTDWATWTNQPGTNQDAKVSDEFAASGTKSLKIFATSTSGGPMDILLPFKGTYNKGHFIQYMKMYIPEDKNAYFNYQAAATPGQTWTLNGFFRANGELELTNSANGTLFVTSFPHGQWFDFMIDVNLDLNVWKVIIDGECVGSFKNSNLRVSSLNLYPIDANSIFFVDDIGFSHDPVAPEINNDMGVSNLVFSGGRLTGTSSPASFQLTNNGAANIDEVVLEINVNGTIEMKTLSGLDLAPGEAETVSLDEEVTLVEGKNDIVITVLSVNGQQGDDESCNNKGSLSFTSVTPAQYKAVLIEEATGTWCPWCVRGTVFMDLLSHRYEGYYIPVAVHNNDPMMVAEYDDYITGLPGFTGFPSAAVNRANITDPSQLESPFLTQIAVPTDVVIDAGMDYDASSRMANIAVFTDFIEGTDEEYHVNLILTEDGVRGTGSGWGQANAYAGGANGPMGGYENLPATVPASQMVYDHVGRAVIGLTKSPATTISGTFAPGERSTLTFSVEIPAGWNTDNMYVIPVVLKNNVYVNAKEVSWADAMARGTSNIDFSSQPLSEIKLFPNPASQILNIDVNLQKASEVYVQIYDVQGRMIGQSKYNVQPGQNSCPLNVEQLNNGIYLARILSNEGSSTQKFVVKK